MHCTCDEVHELDPLHRYREVCDLHDVEQEGGLVCAECGGKDHSTYDCDYLGFETAAY